MRRQRVRQAVYSARRSCRQPRCEVTHNESARTQRREAGYADVTLAHSRSRPLRERAQIRQADGEQTQSIGLYRIRRPAKTPPQKGGYRPDRPIDYGRCDMLSAAASWRRTYIATAARRARRARECNRHAGRYHGGRYDTTRNRAVATRAGASPMQHDAADEPSSNTQQNVAKRHGTPEPGAGTPAAARHYTTEQER